MSSGGINLDHVQPQEYDLPNPVSNSTSILRKTQVRFLPNAQVIYTPNGNNIIEFTVSSPTEQLLLPESYFIAEFYRSDGTTMLDYNAVVDKAGVHSFFKSIQIRAAGANVQISEAREYNRFSNLTLPYNSSPFTVETKMGVEGMGRYEDFMEEHLPDLHWPLNGIASTTEIVRLSGDIDTGLYFTRIVNASSSFDLAIREKVGDPVAINLFVYSPTEDPTNIYFTTAALVANEAVTNATLKSTASIAKDHPIGSIISFETVQAKVVGYRGEGILKVEPLNLRTSSTISLKTSLSYLNTNRRRASNRRRILEKSGEANRNYWIFKPNMAFFSYNFPLYTVKGGITFRLELERPELVFKTGLDPSTSASLNMDYVIKRPRFVGMMSAPEPSVMRDTVSQWNSAEGLVYYLPSYLYRESQTMLESGNVAINFHAGVRSARSILLVVQMDHASQSVSSAVCKAVDSLSQTLRTKISTWQVQIGAHLFPMERLDITKTVSGIYYNEALHRMMYMTQNSNAWIPYSEFNEEQYLYAKDNDTRKTLKEAKNFMIWVDLSRSNTANSILTGTDLSLVPLQFNIERDESLPAVTAVANDGGYGGTNLIYRAFIFYDQFLRMSSNMITTLQ